MNVQVIDGDLLDQDVDVIANAWNRNIIPWWSGDFIRPIWVGRGADVTPLVGL
jgi:hypothetical protein